MKSPSLQILIALACAALMSLPASAWAAAYLMLPQAVELKATADLSDYGPVKGDPAVVTATFQRAVDSLRTGAATLLLPPGDIRISAPIDLYGLRQRTMRGTGKSTTRIVQTGNCPVLTFRYPVRSRSEDLHSVAVWDVSLAFSTPATVHTPRKVGLCHEGNVAGGGSLYGSEFHNVNVDGAYDGVAISPEDPKASAAVWGCLFDGITVNRPVRSGFYFAGGSPIGKPANTFGRIAVFGGGRADGNDAAIVLRGMHGTRFGVVNVEDYRGMLVDSVGSNSNLIDVLRAERIVSRNTMPMVRCAGGTIIVRIADVGATTVSDAGPKGPTTVYFVHALGGGSARVDDLLMAVKSPNASWEPARPDERGSIERVFLGSVNARPVNASAKAFMATLRAEAAATNATKG